MFNLNIHNFRSFQNQNFNFSKVNILIGENSGGKSSLLKFLLSLKQTLESPDEFNLKLKGDFTDLGNYEEVIYNKKKKSNLDFKFSNKEEYFDFFIKAIESIEYKAEKDTLKKIIKIIEGNQNYNTDIQLVLSNKLDEHSSIKTIIKNENIGEIEIIQKESKEDIVFRELNCDIKFNFKNANGIIKDCTAFKEGFFTLIGVEIKKNIKDNFDENQDYIYYSLVYLLLFQNYISEQIEKIRFVNPIGNSPKRFYFQEDKKASYKLIDIEKFINVIGDSSLTKKEYKER